MQTIVGHSSQLHYHKRLVYESFGLLSRSGRGEMNLSKMNFIKYNLIRVPDAPESCDKGQSCDDCQGELVIPLRIRG